MLAQAIDASGGRHCLVHALVTKVEVALVQAPPEYFVSAQVRYLTRVAEDEAVLALPAGLASLRIERVAIRTLDPDVLFVSLNLGQ